jgi:hypothetical protein
MQQFIKKLLLFVLPAIILYVMVVFFVLPSQIEKSEGISTEMQIKQSFKNAISLNYSTLILGNSTSYRGINPSLLSEPAYNFSHDNDSYNQIYYKLLYLKQNNKFFNKLILNVDFFQFSFIADSRNYVYANYLGSEYLKDYETNYWNDFLNKTNILKFQRLRYLKNLVGNNKSLNVLKENGQFIRPAYDKDNDSLKYNIKRLPLQEAYFNKILMFCQSNNIELYLITMPARQLALRSYTANQLLEFDNFIKSKTNSDIKYLNFAFDKSYKVEDYTDITHFNEAAADKFTIQLNNAILNK